MPLVRLLYLSKSTLEDGVRTRLEQLEDIMDVAVRRNKSKNITGALAYNGEYFIQVLEGERDDVWEIFQSIFSDKRHIDVTLNEFREVEERLFGNWYMALATRNQNTDALFERFEREGNIGERGATEMLHFLTKLSEVGFDRIITQSQRSVA